MADAVLSAGPMPCPVSRYHHPLSLTTSMRAALIAARNEGRLSCTDLAKRLDHVLHARDSRGIGARADENEVVVHDLETLHAVALGDELLLERPGVHEHHVRVAAASDVER